MRKLFVVMLLVLAQNSLAKLVRIESLFEQYRVSSLNELFVRIDKPLVLDVYGDGCPHCSRFAPLFYRAAEAAGEQAYFASFNHTTIAGNQAKGMFGIRQIPYVVMVNGGSVQYNGVFTASQLQFHSLLRQYAGVTV